MDSTFTADSRQELMIAAKTYTKLLNNRISGFLTSAMI